MSVENLIGTVCMGSFVSSIDADYYSLLALVKGAGMYKLARPQITKENVVLIKDGRYVFLVPNVQRDVSYQ